MQLVLLQDVVSGFGASWARIANTEGVDQIKPGDSFREQGFGPGTEELKVGGIDISPVGGLSRLYFERGANNTPPMTHRLGAVLLPVGAGVGRLNDDDPSDVRLFDFPVATSNATTATVSVSNQPLNGLSELEDFPAPQNLVAVKPSKAAANAVRQKRFRERKKLENSQHP